jgi:hypothetical protein
MEAIASQSLEDRSKPRAPEAGKRSAIMYTLILSCKRFGIEPLAYVTDVLGKLPSMTNQSDFELLLPANWKPA